MPATNQTPYAHLPQFEPSDKPTWLGDYNNSMLAIDGELSKQNTENISQNQKIGEALTKAGEAQAAADQAQKDAAAAKQDAADANAKFPVSGENLADGSVSAPKLDASAIASIIKGLAIRAFDSNDAGADNDGLVVADGVTLSGAYIPELEILFIRQFSSDGTSMLTGGVGGGTKLPSYVRRPVERVYISDAGIIAWDSSSDFKSWSAVSILPNGSIVPNTTVGVGVKASSFGTMVVCMSPFTGGAAYTGDAYAAFSKENGML